MPTRPDKPDVQLVEGASLQVTWAAVAGTELYALYLREGKVKRVLHWSRKKLDDCGIGEGIPANITTTILRSLIAGSSYKAPLRVSKAGDWSEEFETNAAVEFPLQTRPDKPDVQLVEGVSLQVT